MKRTVTAISLTLILAGCAGTAPSLIASIPGAQQATEVCQSMAPLVQRGSVAADPKARNLASYANSVCTPLSAGAVPPTVNTTTPQWLTIIGDGLKVALMVAPLVL